MAGQWLLSDVLHVPGGGLGFLVVGGVVVWLGRSSKPRFTPPKSVDGWLERCTKVLDQFESFEADVDANERRRGSLRAVVERSGPQRMALVTVDPSSAPILCCFKRVLRGQSHSNSLFAILWFVPMGIGSGLMFYKITMGSCSACPIL